MFSLLPYLLMQVAICVGESTAAKDQVQGCAAEPYAATAAQLQGITAFYRDCLQVSVIHSVIKKASSWASYSLPSGLHEGNVIVKPESAEEPDRISFDPVDGTVYYYSSGRWRNSSEGKDLKRNDAIPEDCAWNQVLPLLKHYGLSVSRDEYDISLDNSLSTSGTDDLYGVCWTFFRKLSYGKTPCRPALIMVRVSAQTGEIVSLFYYPAVAPLETQWLISNTEAVKRVKAWVANNARLKGMQVTLDDTDVDRVQMVIAQPNEWNPPLQPKTTSGIRDKAYYCWEVQFRAISESKNPDFAFRDEYTFGAWVRADTGDVIGGWEIY